MIEKNAHPPRVLFIQRYFAPDVFAVAQLLGNLTEELVRTAGWQVTVLCGSRSASGQNGGADRASIPSGVRIHRLPSLRLKTRSLPLRALGDALFYVSVFIRMLMPLRYDVIVCMSSPPLIGGVVSLALTMRRVPLVYYVEDLYPELLFDMGYIRIPWLIRKLAIANRLTIARSSAVVSLGAYMTRKLLINYGLRASKLVEIPNWSMSDEYIAPVSPRPFILMYSGNLGLAHGFELMDGLLTSLRSEPDLAFEFVGGGASVSDVRARFERVREERVLFTGYLPFQDHVAKLWTAHMFIVSQKPETVGDILPSKLYSYLSVGRPILLLGTRKSEIGELILNNGIGCVLEVPDDISHALDFILRMKRDWDEFVRVCGKVRAVYSGMGFEASLGKFRSLIEGMVG